MDARSVPPREHVKPGPSAQIAMQLCRQFVLEPAHRTAQAVADAALAELGLAATDGWEVDLREGTISRPLPDAPPAGDQAPPPATE